MKKPLPPPDMAQLWSEITNDSPQRLYEIFSQGQPVDARGRYLHWDQMRHRTPPEGFTLKEWWFGTAASRDKSARDLPLTGTDGNPFRFTNIDRVQEMVHRIDQQASGRIETDEIVANFGSRNRYLVSSLVEEAITSSLLEGAATTRRVAKELLRTHREPHDTSERMILNNYLAMRKAQEIAVSGDRLVPDHVLELHRIVTDGTLPDESESGRLQEPGEDRVVVEWDHGQVLHVPPSAEDLPARLEQFCAFANGEAGEGFLHPVVRAILLHFWIGYDHPFADGNGRTARAVFYWSMLRSGYWLAQYISISSILRRSLREYVLAYLYTETDSNDVTYFVIHQLEVLELAIEGLRAYLGRRVSEISEVERLLRGVPGLNHRQLAVIGEALRDPDAYFTIAGHERVHRVAYQSARTDLLGLQELGVLRRVQSGKKFEFWPVDDLSDRLRVLAEESH